MKIRIVLISLISICFFSCQEERKSALDLFKDKTEELLLSKSAYFEKDSLVNPYLLLKIDTFIIVHDVYDLKHFTVFNSNTGKFITRFGNIGVGPGELLVGNILGIYNKNLFSVDHPRRYVIKYDLNAIVNNNASYVAETVAKFDLVPEFDFSRIVQINDSCFVGGGVYKSKYQNICLNKKGEVIDYGIEIFNSQEPINEIYKFLSNQGTLVNHPNDSKFVYSVSNSSNIDFFEVRNEKLGLIKSLRLNNPKFKNKDLGNETYSIDRENSSILGYLDISATTDFVYTLYKISCC